MEELLKQHNLYWAFPLATSLQDEIRQIAISLHTGQCSKNDLADVRKRFVRVLNQSIDAGFEFYYQKPTDQDDNLSPLAKRTVDSIINTVRHAIHLVVQQLFKNMPLDELTLMSYYLDSMILPGNEKYAHLAFPLNEDIRLQLVKVADKITKTQSMTDYSSELEAIFAQVVRQSTHYYYQVPSGLLKLNRFAKKAADLGIEGATRGIEKIIHRVIKDVSHKQVLMLFDNLRILVIPAEPDYEVASPHFVADKKPQLDEITE